MKKKDLNNLRVKDLKELEKTLNDKKIELIKVKAQMTANKEKNLKKAKMFKKEISQISTIIAEKELANDNVSEVSQEENKKS